jgi:hypothetical protein
MPLTESVVQSGMAAHPESRATKGPIWGNAPRWSRPSQSFKPRQDGCIRSPQCRSLSVVDRVGLLDGFSLHLKIGGGIAVCRGDTSVAKPLADREDVDPRSQQMYPRCYGACCGGPGACKPVP